MNLRHTAAEESLDHQSIQYEARLKSESTLRITENQLMHSI